MLRKFAEIVTAYSILRLPISLFANWLEKKDEGSRKVMESKWFIAAEVGMILLIGGIRSAGCFARFVQEEIIQSA